MPMPKMQKLYFFKHSKATSMIKKAMFKCDSDLSFSNFIENSTLVNVLCAIESMLQSIKR